MSTGLTIVFGGYYVVTNMIPHSLRTLYACPLQITVNDDCFVVAFSMIQTMVALLALGTLIFLVLQHHEREGQLLTHAQEEMILMGAGGLFWIAILIAFRAYRQRGGEMGVSTGSLSPAGARTGVDLRDTPRNRAAAAAARGSPCDENGRYCIVEEWMYY